MLSKNVIEYLEWSERESAGEVLKAKDFGNNNFRVIKLFFDNPEKESHLRQIIQRIFRISAV